MTKCALAQRGAPPHPPHAGPTVRDVDRRGGGEAELFVEPDQLMPGGFQVRGCAGFVAVACLGAEQGRGQTLPPGCLRGAELVQVPVRLRRVRTVQCAAQRERRRQPGAQCPDDSRGHRQILSATRPRPGGARWLPHGRRQWLPCGVADQLHAAGGHVIVAQLRGEQPSQGSRAPRGNRLHPVHHRIVVERLSQHGGHRRGVPGSGLSNGPLHAHQSRSTPGRVAVARTVTHGCGRTTLAQRSSNPPQSNTPA